MVVEIAQLLALRRRRPCGKSHRHKVSTSLGNVLDRVVVPAAWALNMNVRILPAGAAMPRIASAFAVIRREVSARVGVGRRYDQDRRTGTSERPVRLVSNAVPGKPDGEVDTRP